MPKVSVICTVFNKEKHLEKALESVLSQKTDFKTEILIVDDKSSDGSADIIKRYKDEYPDLIRAFFHEENQGITKTWIGICREARGKYIARLDTDDYWTDEHKLQKQVDVLERSAGCGWCSTEFDAVDENGNIIHKDCLKNNITKDIKSFEDMLLEAGFTCASTWLCDTALMNKVNEEIPVDSVDDSFCIQLELFKRTKLITIYESMAVYRVLAESDSHISDADKMNIRMKIILRDQKYYVQKFDDSDFKYMICRLLESDFELRKEYEKLSKEYSELLKEHSLYVSEHSKLAEKHGTLVEEHSKWIDAHAALVREHSSLNEKYSESQKELERLKAALPDIHKSSRR